MSENMIICVIINLNCFCLFVRTGRAAARFSAAGSAMSATETPVVCLPYMPAVVLLFLMHAACAIMVKLRLSEQSSLIIRRKKADSVA
jgi:hypothetical protein